ncbi:MAG: decarboxylase [Rhodospirillaceae bacterium]|jgi:maleate isomerase/arylmalonate decarboxylase|nr:decarboxylase [Rhodospirillaceae bacterium]MBT3886495.1 decarboxylase [Rhodospirillaceae bacterium]MBT4116203.1 decarboxylase [Rhodospirillaceae bacterium]MBT4718647.1 decarboxylase [Rhodospirillaceae bacterium]MBT5180826.1 decarboxylase [Rhodospirillaceae bacterium]
MTAEPRRHQAAYGWRAKIGVIVPPTNTVNEAEWNMMAPDGVTIHAARMALHLDTSSDAGKAALYADVERTASDLAQAGLDAIAYGCTAGSMVQPAAALGDFMTKVSGINSVTTAASILAALDALGVKRIAVATPYHDALNDHEVTFLEGAGFDVVHIQGLGIGAGGPGEYPQIARTEQSDIEDHIISADRAGAEAMVVSCTDFPVLGLIAGLEMTLAKPVITSNQATFWAALRAAGIGDRFENYGKLLKDY